MKVCSCNGCAVSGMQSCPICGQKVCLNVIEKRKYRFADDPLLLHCKDCRQKPQKVCSYLHPVLGQIWCIPWQGELSEDLKPIDDNGDLVEPGDRVCGHSDCMNKKHIVQFRRVVDDVESIVEEWKNAPLPKE